MTLPNMTLPNMTLQTAFVTPTALVARSTTTVLPTSRCRLTGRPRPVAPCGRGASGPATLPRHFVFACDKPRSADRPEQGDAGSSSSSNGDEQEAAAKPPSSPDEAAAPHDIPQSAIDWNKSWADFQAGGAKTMAPEGREPISKEELARQRATNRVRDMSNRLPSRQQLFSDWRFWVAIVLTLSLFSAFVQSTSSPVSSVGTI